MKKLLSDFPTYSLTALIAIDSKKKYFAAIIRIRSNGATTPDHLAIHVTIKPGND